MDDETLKVKHININGSNSFINLVNEFAENFTDFNSSTEINKYASNGQVNNKDFIRIGDENYMDFEASLSLLDSKPKIIIE
jgi:ABC-type phosphate transport system substrate-binding protein